MEELLRILEKNARMPIEDIAAMQRAISAAMRRSWTGNKPVSTSSRLSLSCA